MQKAAVIDKHADYVCAALSKMLERPGTCGQLSIRDEIVHVARARHILGHYEYGDTNLFEWSDGKVRAAIIEELADAVVYQAWLEERASE